MNRPFWQCKLAGDSKGQCRNSKKKSSASGYQRSPKHIIFKKQVCRKYLTFSRYKMKKKIYKCDYFQTCISYISKKGEGNTSTSAKYRINQILMVWWEYHDIKWFITQTLFLSSFLGTFQRNLEIFCQKFLEYILWKIKSEITGIRPIRFVLSSNLEN